MNEPRQSIYLGLIDVNERYYHYKVVNLYDKAVQKSNVQHQLISSVKKTKIDYLE